jgi:hypothetical protein
MVVRGLVVVMQPLWNAIENYCRILDHVHQKHGCRYSLPALILELSRHELETGDPNVDRTMRLTDQERQTREVWLVLVYLTLHNIGHRAQSGVAVPPRPTDTLGLGALVDSTVRKEMHFSVCYCFFCASPPPPAMYHPSPRLFLSYLLLRLFLL